MLLRLVIALIMLIPMVSQAQVQLEDWKAQTDTATINSKNSATGATELVTTPTATSREYDGFFTNAAGERFTVHLPSNTTAHHWVYSTSIYLDNPADIANLEFDINQVLPNGEVVIFGFQCDGWNKVWDYTENVGTATSPKAHWLHSSQHCPAPKTWKAKTWHKLKISEERDDYGNVTYHGVTLDGVYYKIERKVFSQFNLHWGLTVMPNFQIDSLATGDIKVYLDKLTLTSY